jgi:hypothetical protein
MIRPTSSSTPRSVGSPDVEREVARIEGVISAEQVTGPHDGRDRPAARRWGALTTDSTFSHPGASKWFRVQRVWAGLVGPIAFPFSQVVELQLSQTGPFHSQK